MKEKARKLRKNQTEAETLMWNRLRNRRLAGYKFKRQHPIGPYITDFVCIDKKLIIELDGSQHLDQADYDEARSIYLEGRGYKVLRFWNNVVFQQTDTILMIIQRALNGENIDNLMEDQ